MTLLDGGVPRSSDRWRWRKPKLSTLVGAWKPFRLVADAGEELVQELEAVDVFGYHSSAGHRIRRRLRLARDGCEDLARVAARRPARTRQPSRQAGGCRTGQAATRGRKVKPASESGLPRSTSSCAGEGRFGSGEQLPATAEIPIHAVSRADTPAVRFDSSRAQIECRNQAETAWLHRSRAAGVPKCVWCTHRKGRDDSRPDRRLDPLGGIRSAPQADEPRQRSDRRPPVLRAAYVLRVFAD